ncbi:MAG TPA: PQQ-binding-like beta-propeller repeat protein [Gaiellaceae bacterium]
MGAWGLQRRAALLFAACGLLVAAAVGCGGSSQPTTTTTPPTSTQSAGQTTRPAPVRRRVKVSVIDGDTGKPVAGAVVSAPGTTRSGAALLARASAKRLTVTATAPHYGAQTAQFRLGQFRRGRTSTVTLSLYRPDGQWLMYGASPARTQTQSTIHIRPPFKVVWSRYLGTLLEFPAVVSDGVAYLSNLHGQLFALSMRDGATLWRVDMHTREEDSSPAVVGDDLIAHVKAGRVLVLDRATGRIRWTFHTTGEVESSPVVMHGIDYLGDWAGDVYALDLRTHKTRWVYHDGCKITASATIAGGALFLGDYCGRVIALQRSTGRLLWSRSAGGVVYGTSATAAGRLFVPSRASESLYAFKTDGTYLWHVSTGGLVYSAPAVWHGRVYFGSYTGELYCVSAATGEVLWRIDAGGPISGSPTVIDGVVYTGTFGHRIVGADALTGHVLFTFPHGEYVAVSGNRGKLLLYGWASLWAVRPLHPSQTG